MKKVYKTILLIIIIGYILRVLPYLLGYPTPVTDDALRDFQQVIYLVENNKINLASSCGAFPLLHLLVFGISRLGFDVMKVFLFVPQIFASLGIFFFFLFLKKYFPVRESLFACFLIAVFGPHIHWSSQPVRETMGLFFFPLLIYLFDKELTDSKTSHKILLFISFALMTLSHHWSTFMALGFLFFATLFFYKNRLLYALLLTVIFSVLALFYWYFLASSLFGLILQPLDLLLRLLVTLLFFIGIIIFLRRLDLNKLKNTLTLTFSLIIILLLPLALKKVIVFAYPLQFLISFVIFIILILIGFFYNKDKNLDNLFKTNLLYLSLFIITWIYLLNRLDFVHFLDPLRLLEFAIFPCSIAASFGFFWIAEKAKTKYLLPFSVVILIVLGTLTYPPVFIYRRNFENTPFYDIRSDLRYIPGEGFELMEWAHDHGYSVRANNYVITEYQNTFYAKKDKNLLLLTKSDYKISENYSYYIKHKILGIPDPKILIEKSKGLKPVYSNEWGSLYEIEDTNLP